MVSLGNRTEGRPEEVHSMGNVSPVNGAERRLEVVRFVGYHVNPGNGAEGRLEEALHLRHCEPGECDRGKTGGGATLGTP